MTVGSVQIMSQPGDGLGEHLCEAFSLGGRGPVVAIKDVIDVAGRRTRAGSAALDGVAPAERHAAVVESLLAARCRIVGKLLMHELAFGVTGINAWAGTPPNPRFPGYVPGGSSSGSASVVAAGLVDFSLGTDTGGSIRVPAACCGVVGLKPTYGRLSRAGLTPVESSLDCVGPLAGDVTTVARAMAILDPAFTPRSMPGRVRVAWIPCEADNGDAVRACIDRACAGDTSIEVVTAALPSLAEAHEAGLTIMNAEAARAFGHLVGTGRLGPDVEARLRAAFEISATAVDAAERVRVRFRDEVDRALSGVDVLAMPTLPGAALRLDQAQDAQAARASTRLARPFNLSGHPAISVPVPAEAGGPMALQLVGARGDDEALCAAAEHVETAMSRARMTRGSRRKR